MVIGMSLSGKDTAFYLFQERINNFVLRKVQIRSFITGSGAKPTIKRPDLIWHLYAARQKQLVPV